MAQKSCLGSRREDFLNRIVIDGETQPSCRGGDRSQAPASLTSLKLASLRGCRMGRGLCATGTDITSTWCLLVFLNLIPARAGFPNPSYSWIAAPRVLLCSC